LPKLFSEILGKEVEVPERPRRIISFSPAATETLFKIGRGDDVVGVSAFCARPPEATKVRRVGSYNTVRPELLDELAPDLVFTVTGYQRSFAVDLSTRYPVYPLELPISVAGIVDFVTKVGLVVGAADEARELSGTLIRSMGRVRKTGNLLAYVEIDLGGPVSFGAHSYITDAFRFLGASTLFENERTEWLTPDLNVIRIRDPDLIVYEPKMYSKFGEADLRNLIVSRKWSDLRAVARKNCFLTRGPLDFLANRGPSFITEAIPWLEHTIGRARGNLL